MTHEAAMQGMTPAQRQSSLRYRRNQEIRLLVLTLLDVLERLTPDARNEWAQSEPGREALRAVLSRIKRWPGYLSDEEEAALLNRATRLWFET